MDKPNELSQAILELKADIDNVSNPTVELTQAQLSGTLGYMVILSDQIAEISKITLSNSEAMRSIIKLMQEKT